MAYINDKLVIFGTKLIIEAEPITAEEIDELFLNEGGGEDGSEFSINP